MKKIIIILLGTLIVAWQICLSAQTKQSQKTNILPKYTYTFINNIYQLKTDIKVKVKYSNGGIETGSLSAATIDWTKDGSIVPSLPLIFTSNFCLTDLWVSGKIEVGARAPRKTVDASTDHHGLNMCKSNTFNLVSISNSPYIQVNWTP